MENMIKYYYIYDRSKQLSYNNKSYQYNNIQQSQDIFIFVIENMIKYYYIYDRSKQLSYNKPNNTITYNNHKIFLSL